MKFLHSKDEGVVTALLDDRMVSVLLDEVDMEIPAFVDDLVRAEDHRQASPSVKAKVIPGKKKPGLPAPPHVQTETQFGFLKSKGVLLAFDPGPSVEIRPEKYSIFLVNDSSYDFLFSFSLQLRGVAVQTQSGRLPACSFLQLGALRFDQLNDSPSIAMECWRLTTEGTGSRLHRKLRIKPKQFFKKMGTAPLLNRKVHLFRLFEKEDIEGPAPKKAEDLQTYTKRRLRHPEKSWDELRERYPHDILEYAEFVPELDLHLEKLNPDHPKMSNVEILRLQIRHFENFMATAIRLGAERVFIIHGVGTGRLRDTIASRLKGMPEVLSFKNEYHPRYGWGATEVIFE